MSVRWTEKRAAYVRRRYVDEFALPAQIAAELGLKPHQVKSLVRRRGWTEERGEDARRAMKALTATNARNRRAFDWTDERVAVFERLYLGGERPRAIAERLGGGCTHRMVQHRAATSGLAARRDPAVLQAMRQANAAAGRASPRRKPAESVAVLGVDRSAGPDITAVAVVQRGRVVAVRRGQDRLLSAEMRAAIDAAIAAGRVTLVPPSAASGLSRLEAQFWAAGPARPEDPAEAERQRARGVRAGRKSMLAAAGRVRG